MIMQTSLYIVQYGHIFKESNILECSCDSCFINIDNTSSGDILTIQLDNSLCWLINTCKKIKYGCFSGTVWSDQTIKLAFFDFQLKIIYSMKAAKLYGKIIYL